VSGWDCDCADLALQVCTHLCPHGAITAIDPPNGVVDARYPVDCSGGTVIGLSAMTINGPPGAGSHCWSICDSSGAEAPAIKSVTEIHSGTYTVVLDRPITPLACTSIIYDRNGPNEQSQTFKSHPGDVGADGMSSAADVLVMIDALNGIPAPFGAYSTDIDRSGASNAADVLAVIDLLNGASCFDSWNNVTFPGCGICPPP